jgi:hypothetical protein
MASTLTTRPPRATTVINFSLVDAVSASEGKKRPLGGGGKGVPGVQSCGHCVLVINLCIPQNVGNSRLAKQLSASQEGFCAVELVSCLNRRQAISIPVLLHWLIQSIVVQEQ